MERNCDAVAGWSLERKTTDWADALRTRFIESWCKPLQTCEHSQPQLQLGVCAYPQVRALWSNGLLIRLSRSQAPGPRHDGFSEHGCVPCLGRSVRDPQVELVVDLEFKAGEPRVVLESEPVRSHYEFRFPGLSGRRVGMPGTSACRGGPVRGVDCERWQLCCGPALPSPVHRARVWDGMGIKAN